MKNKEFQKLLKKQKYNSNSGFTLTELLVGLIMSIFVVGALGFGLMAVLRTTQRENSKTAARNENSRALDFISDEVRRARTIETDLTNARVTTTTGVTTAFNVENTNIDPATGGFNSNTTTNKKIVFAIDIPEVSSSATLGADADPDTTERIIYFLKSAGTTWRGPSVLYRWGPPLRADGSYSDGEWSEQALIDGIDNTHRANSPSPCATGTPTPPILTGTAPTLSGSALSTAATGFYACITGTNTAQLFLTGQTQVAIGVNDTQTNDSQVVARARTALADRTDENNAMNWDIEGLGGSFNCVPPDLMWDMQTDFTSKDPDDPDNPSKTKTTSWTQSTNMTRQAQAIEVDTEKTLTVTSSAVGKTNCINTPAPISHTINFEDPRTFNGNHETDDTRNASVVGSGEVVQFFKKGFNIPPYGGYNPDGGAYNPSQGDQRSLGQFLYDKGLAIPVSGDPPVIGDPDNINTIFRLPKDDTELNNYLATSGLSDAEKARFKVLGDDQRIIGFEMGQTDTTQPGFDLQDNIFVVTSSVFKKKFRDCAFSNSCT